SGLGYIPCAHYHRRAQRRSTDAAAGFLRFQNLP
ncbi:MAG: hypothetical protein ACI8PT_002822, partial [Gammaproteobacteria bacterium]